tara:strand:- start:7914 stop:10058 length:2145 start_codon:yes stop_codon:yes gene_type:complete
MDILRKDAEDDAARLREMLGIKDDGTYEQRAERPEEKKPEEKPKKKVKPPETRVLFGQVGYKQKDKERERISQREIESAYDSLGKDIDDSWLQVWVWYSDDIMGGLDSWTRNLFTAEESADGIAVELGIKNPFTRNIMVTGGPTSQRMRPTGKEFKEAGGRGKLRSQHRRQFQAVVKDYDKAVSEALKGVGYQEPRELTDAEVSEQERESARQREERGTDEEGKPIPMQMPKTSEKYTQEDMSVMRTLLDKFDEAGGKIPEILLFQRKREPHTMTIEGDDEEKTPTREITVQAPTGDDFRVPGISTRRLKKYASDLGLSSEEETKEVSDTHNTTEEGTIVERTWTFNKLNADKKLLEMLGETPKEREDIREAMLRDAPEPGKDQPKQKIGSKVTRRTGPVAGKVSELYQRVKNFFDEVFNILSVEQAPTLESEVLDVTAGIGVKGKKAAKEKRERQDQLGRTLARILKNHAEGNEKTAGEALSKISADNLILIQKFLTRGNKKLARTARDALIENYNDSKWDAKTKRWVNKKTGEPAYKTYAGRSTLELIPEILNKNKKRILPDRRTQGQILSELEEFSTPDFKLTRFDQEGGKPRRKEYTLSEMMKEVKQFISGEDKQLPLRGSAGNTYRKLLFKVIEKLRNDYDDGKTDELASDIEMIEFLYAVLRHIGKSRRISDVALERVEDIATTEEIPFDTDREFDLPPLSPPSKEEE